MTSMAQIMSDRLDVAVIDEMLLAAMPSPDGEKVSAKVRDWRAGNRAFLATLETRRRAKLVKK